VPECAYTSICDFFVSEVGYSPELNHNMKQHFCLEDNTHCARLLAMDIVGENIPVDMLPTDTERLTELDASM